LHSGAFSTVCSIIFVLMQFFEDGSGGGLDVFEAVEAEICHLDFCNVGSGHCTVAVQCSAVVAAGWSIGG
jgi:hypothetical protein